MATIISKRVKSPNSPFHGRDDFPAHQAERWVRAGRARIEDGLLVFNSEVAWMFRNIAQREALDAVDAERYQRMVDDERAGTSGAPRGVAVWAARPSGIRSKILGAPVLKSRQMSVRFPKK